MNLCSSRRFRRPKGEVEPWEDRVFITRSAPEVCLVSWYVRSSPTILRIQDDPGVVCDACGGSLDWEPFAVIDLPSDEELKDDEYVPVGGTALCTACALQFYRLTQRDVGQIDRVWLCYGCVEQITK